MKKTTKTTKTTTLKDSLDRLTAQFQALLEIRHNCNTDEIAAINEDLGCIYSQVLAVEASLACAM